MAGSPVPFTKGLHELGNGHFAWLQPSGTWGYSNAGLIVDGDQSLLVDTLFDERLTAEMLAEMRRITGFGAKEIAQLVNTHANGDHTFGNRLLVNARIHATDAGAHEMAHEAPPEMLADLMARADELGDLGRFLKAIFHPFDFAGVRLRLPDETFRGEKTLMVGDKRIDLVEVGPAHTGGDTLVFVPQDRIVYTGDIIFVDGTPIMWAGPVGNWLAACDRMLAADIDIVVPGHGPVTDKAGVRRMRDYLVFVDAETRKRHMAGMDAWEAAQDIALCEFGSWEDPERIAVTIDTIYREIDGETGHRDILGLFEKMAALDKVYNPARTCAAGYRH